MAKDPAVLFYTSDFITGTTFFTMEERGVYITLLCMQHQQGSINEKDMLNMCGSHERVLQKFDKDLDGTYYNKRMREEAIKRKLYSESRKKNRSKNKTEDKKNTSITYVPHMENENENENIIDTVSNNTNIMTLIQKYAYVCMSDTDRFIAPLHQKLSNVGFERELLPQYFDDFNQMLEMTNDTNKSDQDYRRHFINWLTKKLQNEKFTPTNNIKDPNGKPINRIKHPLFPSDYPYTGRNIYFYENNKSEMMNKQDTNYN